MAINSLNASSNGLSGLVSGINTQEMVEKLLSGTQSKIDKAGQKKTVLQYKQGMYRDVAAKLKTLQQTYLSFTSKTNLLSSSFYNTMNASIKAVSGRSPAFSVTATSSAPVGSVTVKEIRQLAQSQKITYKEKATGDVSGTLDQNAAKTLLDKYSGPSGRMGIRVGGQTVYINDAPEIFSRKSPSEIAAYIQDAFDNATDSGGNAAPIDAKVRFINNKLTITAADPETQIVLLGNSDSNSTDKTLALKMFGNDYSTLGGKGQFSMGISPENYMPSIEMNLDGRKEAIRIDLEALKDYADNGNTNLLQQSLKDAVSRAFGTSVDVSISNGEIKFDTLGEGRSLTITGALNQMDMFGLKSGISTTLNTNLPLRDLNFKTELQGSVQTFQINGVQFSYDSGASLNTIISDINSSNAGVKISYNSSKDLFSIENKNEGATDAEITMGQTEGNLLSALFGLEGSGSVNTYAMGKTLVGGTVTDEMINKLSRGGKLSFEVNGTNLSLVFGDRGENRPYSIEEITQKVNDAFRDVYGRMSDGRQSIEFKYETDHFEIVANNPANTVKIVAEGENNKTLLGFEEGDSSRVTKGSTSLTEAGITFGSGGIVIYDPRDPDNAASKVSISGSELDGKTISEVTALLNSRLQQSAAAAGSTASPPPSVVFDSKTSGFRIMGVDVPLEIVVNGEADSKGLDNFFGQDKLTFNAAGAAESQYEKREGRNAVLVLNDGELYERSSNTFTIDGLTYTLHETTSEQVLVSGTEGQPDAVYEWQYKDGFGADQINVSRDTETIVETLQEFLKLYNETIDYINDIYRADTTYKDYPPLTSAQQKEMSATEIEQWTEKAKEGLLRNDQNLERILQSMRTAMFTKPDGSSIALYDLGISTSYYSKDGNFVEKSGNDLKALIEANPEAVAQLFVGEGGIMELLNNAIEDATRGGGNPGLLTRVAGSAISDTNSTIYNQIKDIDTQMVSLEKRYWNEYNRYWKQFNSMEQIIQQMNTQSSWLAGQFGG